MKIKKAKNLGFWIYNVNQIKRFFKHLTFDQIATFTFKASALSVCTLLLAGMIKSAVTASDANNQYDMQIQIQLVYHEAVIQKQKLLIDRLQAKVGSYGESIRKMDALMLGKWATLDKMDKGINDEMAKAIIYYAYKIAPLYDIDPDMVIAIAYVESRLGTNLFGPTGDFGPMQIHHKTWAAELDITQADMLDVRQAIDTACQILERSIARHGDRYVGGYNGFGPGYEERVMKVYAKLQ